MSASAAAVGPTAWQRWVRGILVAGYVALVALGFTTEWQPLVFWTMILPLLPLTIVLAGFHNWREICPLAFFGAVGRQLNRGTQRRVPGWLERWFFVVTFALLLSMLVLRLVATNGDPIWLAGLLAGLAIAAATTNACFTGKTWCNFVCPVGLVERIYTEPNSLPAHTRSSRCIRCTACKKNCPDIDQENAYWKDLLGTERRFATFAFPGLVLAFYSYYWLRHGDWEAYFDGRWTQIPADAELLLGAGFFFAPTVSALVAASLTLLAFSAASYGLWSLVETGVGRLVEDAERRRHLVLALAAFVAFNIFYFFAGAPSLRKLPGGTRALAFLAPLVGTLFLLKRWRRTRERFIRERSAATLLRNWPFDEPPPADPAEVYAWVKAGERAREQRLAAYQNTVREMLTDGLVGAGELRLLEEVRQQLGISQREHEKIFTQLSEDERHLFEHGREASVEERVQVEGYQNALTEALLRGAPETEITELRNAFGVSPETHDALLDRMRGASGVLLTKARTHTDRALAVHRDLAVLSAEEQTSAKDFLAYLLLKAQDAAIERVLEFLEIAGGVDRVRALRTRLFSSDEETRATAIEQLALAVPAAADLVRRLSPLIIERAPRAAERDVNAYVEMLERLATAADPYLRAGAVWAAGSNGAATAESAVSRALDDAHPLVRETAARVAETGSAVPEPGRGLIHGSGLDMDDNGSDTLGRSDPTGSRSPQYGRGPAPGFSTLTTIEKMHFLRCAPLFAELDPQDLHDLCLLAREETVAPPRTLCTEGDMQSDDLFILVDGRAAVVVGGRGEAGENEREIEVLGEGEIVGELSLLDGSPRSATVRPKDGPIRVLRIPGHSFRSLVLHHPHVAQPLMATLAQRIRQVSHRFRRATD